jgi:predicted nuclease of predicted toxin-antitoxin system
MKLFFDECVSAGAAVHFRKTTPHATCHTRDIAMSGATDAAVLARCIAIDHVLITVNGRDFRKLCGTPEQLHPGLVVIPSVSRVRQIELIDAALALIHREAPPQTPEDWMVNRVVEVDPRGIVTHAELPKETP